MSYVESEAILIPELSLSCLDDGAMGVILSKIDLGDICALACTCKQTFHDITRHDSVWRRIFRMLLPYSPTYLPVQPPTGSTWMSVVKAYYVSLRLSSDGVRPNPRFDPVNLPTTYQRLR